MTTLAMLTVRGTTAAEISVDGQKCGYTPANLVFDLGGATEKTLKLELTHLNFRPHSTRVVLQRGKVVSLRADLLPMDGRRLEWRRLFSMISFTKDDANKAASAGSEYLLKGDLENAVFEYSRAISLEPDHPLGYYLRARARWLQRQWGGAVADLSQPRGMPTDRGALFSAMNLYEFALADFDLALELTPDNLEAYERRGRVHQKRGDKTQAAADLARAAEMTSLQGIHSWRVSRLLDEGRRTDALAECMLGIALEQADAGITRAWWYSDRAEVYREQRQYDLAIADLGKAIEACPDYAYAYVVRGG